MEAAFCFGGMWWFVRAGANVTFECGAHNPLVDCELPSTPAIETSSHATEMTTTRGVRECHPEDNCEHGIFASPILT